MNKVDKISFFFFFCFLKSFAVEEKKNGQDLSKNQRIGQESRFVCLSLGFTAQSTQWGHVERGQFT